MASFKRRKPIITSNFPLSHFPTKHLLVLDCTRLSFLASVLIVACML